MPKRAAPAAMLFEESLTASEVPPLLGDIPSSEFELG
jgi:hypothetical protein